MNKIEEFVLVWFEQSQEWVVVLSNGEIISNGFGCVGKAHGAALKGLGRGEAEFECTEDTGSFQRYEKDEMYWAGE